MHVGVLGETEVRLESGTLELTSRKLRQVVAALALAGGRPVSYDALVDQLWGDDLPDGLPGTLHAYVATLRKRLEPDRAPRTPPRLLVTVGTGYALRVADDALDTARFQRLVTGANSQLSGGDPLTAPPLESAALESAGADLDEALGLWRGEPYADLGAVEAVVAERARLEELRIVALEDRAAVRLALGGHAPVAAELEGLTATHPLRERPWVLRALALYAGGRQADALEVLRAHADRLADDLGIEPSPLLRDLQVRILRQDPTLAWSRPPTPTVAAASPAADGGRAPTRPEPTPAPRPDWPMAGRRQELAALVELLDRAATGQPSYAAITGEPGIGKSRLCAEVMAVAAERGARLLVGRCSQDDGAPPLWPWQQVLRQLGRELEVEPGEDEGAAFRTRETIAGLVREAAADEDLLVVLDDLHWADVQTLRVLRLLVETVDRGRLLLLATWRTHPAPAGALADVADTLARSHAVRVPLTGLDVEESAALVGSVTSRTPASRQAAELTRRTDGNPFYVVEFARLASDGDLAPLLRPSAAPAAVRDVVARRIGQQSAAAVATLRHASVVGRTFELPALVAAAGGDRSEDDLLDDLDEAVSAGLLREDGAGRWSFGHALVRDAAYDGLGPTRAARTHARLAAFLTELGGRETEAAHHWLAAGPGHARQAWVAAADAAHVARGLHAHEEAADLLRKALEAAGSDSRVDDADRFRLLMELGEAERWSGQWTRLQAASEAALDIAERMGDPERIGDAASTMTVGAFWQTTSYGEVHDRQVAALRRALDELPTDDSPRRCGLMSSLAVELYYLSGHEERVALVEEAQAMARRLGDDSLLVDACLKGYIALWRPDTAAARLAMVEEACRLAEGLGDLHRLVVARTQRTVVLAELGRIREMWESEPAAREAAERLRAPYSAVVLDGLIVPWLAMSGRLEEAHVALARMDEASKRIVLFQSEEAVLGAVMSLQMWSGGLEGLVEPLLAMEGQSPLPLTWAACQVLSRTGDADRARRHLAELSPAVPTGSDWFTTLQLTAAAETALWVGDARLGGETYELLAPCAGMAATAGSGAAQGPVDAFLAMAAAAVGEQALAARHADDAEALMSQWGVVRCAEWFAGVRKGFGF